MGSKFPAAEQDIWGSQTVVPLGVAASAANLPGDVRWGGESRKPSSWCFHAGLISFLLNLWQQREEGDTPQTASPPGDQNCTQQERAASCIPRLATQPASWGDATRSAAVAQGHSGSSFPWHRPSAERKQTSGGQAAEPSPSSRPQKERGESPSSPAC